jgi:hypothetical protein
VLRHLRVLLLFGLEIVITSFVSQRASLESRAPWRYPDLPASETRYPRAVAGTSSGVRIGSI